MSKETMSPAEVIGPLRAAVHCVREHRGHVRGAEMEKSVEAVAALIAERHEYKKMCRQDVDVVIEMRDALVVRVQKLVTERCALRAAHCACRPA